MAWPLNVVTYQDYRQRSTLLDVRGGILLCEIGLFFLPNWDYPLKT